MDNKIFNELCEIASTLRIMEAAREIENLDEHLSIVAGGLADKLEHIIASDDL